jgi:hypothetical protein
MLFWSHEALAAKAGSTTGGLVFAYVQTVLCLLPVQTLKGLLPALRAAVCCPPFTQKLGAYKGDEKKEVRDKNTELRHFTHTLLRGTKQSPTYRASMQDFHVEDGARSST